MNRVETETLPDGTIVSKTPETVSALRESQPEKLRRRLSGDLDNIVLMALRKDPQRRYVSAEEFSRDIQRHLEHRPLKARPNTLAYRSSKFVRRHGAEVIATVIIMTVLLDNRVYTLGTSAGHGTGKIGTHESEPWRSPVCGGARIQKSFRASG